jgi:hypothetical protein
VAFHKQIRCAATGFLGERRKEVGDVEEPRPAGQRHKIFSVAAVVGPLDKNGGLAVPVVARLN